MGMLVISRVIQGVGGGAMQPLSQAILLESFPPAKRSMATALFGLAIVVAPIVGPTLGGWLTDNWSWRWTFYINLPVGILAFFLMSWVVEDPPYIRAKRSGRFDGIGFGLVALCLGTLQVMLDKGQEADWFSAIWIRWFAVICTLSLIGFIVYELCSDAPLVDLHVFKNRNFAVSSVLFILYGMMIYALITIQPLFVQSLLGYNAFNSGLSVSPRGFGAFAALFFVGILAHKVDSRLLAGVGFAMIGLASFLLSRLTLQMAMSNVVFANIVAGFGIGCLFVPLTTLSVGTLRNEQISNAVGLQNLIRNIGGSFGLSLVSTFQVRFAQAHQSMMVEHLSPLNPQYQHRLDTAQSILEQHFNTPDAAERAHGVLYNTLLQQSNYWAFINLFFMVACACVLSVLVILLYAKPKAVHVVAAAD
jgi:DHA2 family multidrug resistance protein